MYTTPRTWVAGAYPTAAQFNQDVRDNVSFLANPPACRVYHNAAQSIATATDVMLAMNSERFDTDTMHDTVTNNSRITFNTAGLYVVGGGIEFASNTVGRRVAYVRLNGTTNIGRVDITPAGGGEWALGPTIVYKFAVNDYVQLGVYQSSGGALNVLASSGYSPEFFACWLGLG